MTPLRKMALTFVPGLLCAPFVFCLPQEAASANQITQNGITVRFDAGKTALTEGSEANLRFAVTEATGTPLSGSRPAAWIDVRDAQTAGPKDCHDRINSYLQASLGARPLVDLNSYYILALNDDASISVIDPLLSFGTSKLLTMIMLRSPGMDWVMTGDGHRLLVSMPASRQVAVVDLSNWKVVANVDAGPAPTRLALQKDERFLWVTNDGQDAAESGVTVIDIESFKTVARIPTGAGPHEMAMSDDDRYVFVSNRRSGTLTIIDAGKRSAIREIKTGPSPVAPAFSAKSNAVYVASEEDGSVLAVDASSLTVRARMAAQPGVKSLKFTSGGRWGFLANPSRGVVQILDTSSNRFAHNVAIEHGPEEISFSAQFAYIRARDSEIVSMIPLSELGGIRQPVPAEIPGGQLAPGAFPSPSVAATIVPSPEGGAVLVANAADKIIYYYAEGMAAPMGTFQAYGRSPRAVMVSDRSLREVAPGVYSATITLLQSGKLEVAFLLDSPRVAHCFELTVLPNPARSKRPETAIKVEPVVPDAGLRAGKTLRLRFKVTDPGSNQPKTGLNDIGVLAFLAPGIWQKRQWAHPVGNGPQEAGVYEVEFTPPQTGAYYIFWECPSLGVRYNQLSPLVLRAESGP